MALHLLIKYIIAYLTDFWKTNLTKFASFDEKASKGRFLKPENGSKITVTKEKERRKRKSEEIRKGEEEKKSNGCTLREFILSYFGFSFWPKKTVGRKRFI